jgi:hypothetical protein
VEPTTAVNSQSEQRPRRAARALPPCAPWCACRCRQRAHPPHVVHGRGERAHPAPPSAPPMPRRPPPPDGLEPPQDLVHTRALPLTDGIARMARGTPSNGAGAPGRVLGDRRRHPQRAPPLLRRHRRAAGRRVPRVALVRQRRQHPIDQGAYGAQGRVAGHTRRGRAITAPGGLLAIISTPGVVLREGNTWVRKMGPSARPLAGSKCAFFSNLLDALDQGQLA